MYNVVLVSSVQQRDSDIHVHVSILFQILFPFRLLQSIEQSSLCCTVGPCWLSILFIYLYWNRIALQCCVIFCHTMKWISCMYTYIPSLLDLPSPHPTHLGPHRALSWASWALQRVPTSYLFYRNWKGHMHPNVHCSTIYNSQVMETT